MTKYDNKTLRTFELSLTGYRQGKWGAININAYLVDKGIGTQDGLYFSIKETKLKEYDQFFEMLTQLSDLQAKTIKAKEHELSALGEQL